MKEWNKLPPQDRTWSNFKTHFRDVQIASHKTGDLTINKGLNHTKIVNMVSEGVQVAHEEQEPVKQVNRTEETHNLCTQLNGMRELIEKMNNAQ